LEDTVSLADDSNRHGSCELTDNSFALLNAESVNLLAVVLAAAENLHWRRRERGEGNARIIWLHEQFRLLQLA
jgi:hypothetical protein